MFVYVIRVPDSHLERGGSHDTMQEMLEDQFVPFLILFSLVALLFKIVGQVLNNDRGLVGLHVRWIVCNEDRLL